MTLTQDSLKRIALAMHEHDHDPANEDEWCQRECREHYMALANVAVYAYESEKVIDPITRPQVTK